MKPGEHVINVIFSTKCKERWNTYHFGKQTRYNLTATLLNQKLTKKIGIRKLVVDFYDDEYGTTFQFVLNGHIVNALGQNI